MHKLVLDLPEDVYEALVKTAEQTGQSVEDVAVHWLAAATKRIDGDQFEGANNGSPLDWAHEHGLFPGRSLAETR